MSGDFEGEQKAAGQAAGGLMAFAGLIMIVFMLVVVAAAAFAVMYPLSAIGALAVSICVAKLITIAAPLLINGLREFDIIREISPPDSISINAQ